MKSLVDKHNALLLRRTFGMSDDFDNYASGGKWTSVLNGSATIAAGDAQFGVLTLSAIDSTNNRELYLRSTQAVFLFADSKPIYIESRVQFTEQNTSAANVGFGVANAVANGLLVDDGAGMKTSGSFASIFKVDGGTAWKTGCSVGSSQSITQSEATAGGSAYQVLGIQIEPQGTIAEITYFVDGLQLRDSTTRKNPIKDFLTFTGAAAMQLFVGLKNGSTSAETLLVDYIFAEHLRGVVHG